MATMGFHLAYGDPDIRYIGEANTQSFVIGDLVYLNAGLVTIATDDQIIFGVAQANGVSDSVNKPTPVSVISPNQTWIAEYDTSSTAAIVGVGYGLTMTTGDCDVANGETTNTAVVVVDLDPRDGVTTAGGGRVYIKFLPGALQTTRGAGTTIIGS